MERKSCMDTSCTVISHFRGRNKRGRYSISCLYIKKKKKKKMEENQFLRRGFIADVNHAHSFVKHRSRSASGESTSSYFRSIQNVLFLTQDFTGQCESYSHQPCQFVWPSQMKIFSISLIAEAGAAAVADFRGDLALWQSWESGLE